MSDFEPLFKFISEIRNNDDFIKFQDSIVNSAYDSLKLGYKENENENEVKIVSRLVKSINVGGGYPQITMRAKKIHGSSSIVEFEYGGKKVSCELGDMVIITSVTNGNKRLLQRLCIIQNKKQNGNRWKIDNKQLFLLNYFPTLYGESGVLRGFNDLSFHNNSKCLGAYGLLFPPGEMIFSSADHITEMLKGKGSLSREDIAQLNIVAQSESSLEIVLPIPQRLYFDEDFKSLIEHINEAYMLNQNKGQTFLGNKTYAKDIHDLICDWTQLNIGEVTCLNDYVIDKKVDDFTNTLIRSAELEPKSDISNNEELDTEIVDGITVLHMHINLNEER